MECSEWLQFSIILITFVGLFIWNRTEARTDARHMDQKMSQIHSETREMIAAIQQEIKDFHARLCVIEERSRK